MHQSFRLSWKCENCQKSKWTEITVKDISSDPRNQAPYSLTSKKVISAGRNENIDSISDLTLC